jgi:hypothetical protein
MLKDTPARHRCGGARALGAFANQIRLRDKSMTLQHAESTMSTETPRRGHLFCAWCHADFGLLWYSSMYPSYGICARCQRVYFAEYYRVRAVEQTVTVGLKERSVG